MNFLALRGAASPISRGATLVAMVQAADLREGDNVKACGGPCPTPWSVGVAAMSLLAISPKVSVSA
jgi:hypothetical protein